MLRRLISYARYVGALGCATALALAVSVHAADPNRSLENVRTFSATLKARFTDTFAPLGNLFARGEAETPRKLALLDMAPPRVAQNGDVDGPDFSAPVPPSILDFSVADTGHARVAGRAAGGVRIALYSDGVLLADSRTSTSGNWQIEIADQLPHGVHRLQAVAWTEQTGRRLYSEQIRLAVPQRLPKERTPGPPEASATVGAPTIQVAQRDNARDRSRTDRQVTPENGVSWSAPIFDWLRRSSETYDMVIARTLSGEARAGDFFAEDGARRQRGSDDRADVRSVRDPYREGNFGLADALRTRWQVFTTGIEEWLRQARETYRADIVDELSGGVRQLARTVEPDSPDIQPNPFEREPPPRQRRDVAEVAPPPREPQDDRARSVLPDQSYQPGIERFDTPSVTPEPLQEWPVVGQVEPRLPDLPAIEPDPEKRALIRKAEEDAKRARDLARRAAEQARKMRQETEALLAEKRRLEAEASARREAELKAELDAAKLRAAAAEQRARQLAGEGVAEAAPVTPDTETAAKVERRAAEDLAAAASDEGDKRFADGGLDVPSAVQPRVAEGSQAGDVATSQDNFTVADARPSPRLSLKDSARDRVIEEGSTMGEIDDFHPSVRFVYDMGAAPPPKAKRRATAKKRKFRKKVYRKKAKRRSAYKKRKRRFRQRTRMRRAYKRRATRVRRARMYRYRGARRWRRTTRRFGRLYKFKPSAKAFRKRRYARGLYLPRIKWR